MHIDTKCVHSGSGADTVTGGVNTPIFPSSAHEYLDAGETAYPRYFNTFNQNVLVRKICDLEGAEDGVVFSSGMAAISSVMLTFLKSGDHAVLQDEIYGGSHAFVGAFFDRFGIGYTFVETSADAVEEAVRPETKVIFIETPTNPLLGIMDISAVAGVAGRHGCLTVIDNTFATPVLQNPIRLGIDVVVHSGTKYLGGHSDLCFGAVLASKEAARAILRTARKYGGSTNALDCYLMERSLKTLALRVERQNRNAQAVAEFLARHPAVSAVHYPGLPDHEGHQLASKQMRGFGGMLSFELAANSAAAVETFEDNLGLVKASLSLGGVETMLCPPATTSHSELSPEERARLGITDGLLRLSVGIEAAEDIVADLAGALEVVQATAAGRA